MTRNHRIGPNPPIYIDFEGEGTDKSLPKDRRQRQPSLLGALVPSPDGRGFGYRVWLLEAELAPMAKPTASTLPGDRVVASLEEALRELLALAEARDCSLVHFSRHETEIVTQHAPHLQEAFERRARNIKHLTDPLVRKRAGRQIKKTLDNTVGILLPNRSFAARPGRGAAAVCRQLRRAGKSSIRWKSWTALQKSRAADLLKYNRDDCKKLYYLMRFVDRNKPVRSETRRRSKAACGGRKLALTHLAHASPAL
jgi:hypothetical protein